MPKETPFGRKRQIDQDSCNKDYSCLNGFCPSFVTVEGDIQRPTTASRYEEQLQVLAGALPDADVPRIDTCYDLLVTGVGGTGVITVGALITMAAHLERKGASELDFMGFAQKFGPVLSYLRIGEQPADINQVRIEPARADALIGCDLVVSSSPKASITYQKDHTRAVINTAEMLTGDFVRHRDASLNADERVAAIENAVGRERVSTIDANGLARRLMGDTIFANVMMIGCAWQQGLIPVSLDALQRAIELNGVKIDENKQAFTWGRIAATNANAIDDLLGKTDTGINESLDKMIVRRREFLVDYQDTNLADKYATLVERVHEAETALTDDDALSRNVANAYFRLLSYKDEYEVARLHTRPEFLQTIRDDYGTKAKLRFHLAPPLFARKKDARGRPLKKEFGAWMLPVFRVLAGMRGLRGTAFDVFGYTAERRMERGLIREFEAMLDASLPQLTADNRDDLNERVGRFLDLRGYGPVKEAAVESMHASL